MARSARGKVILASVLSLFDPAHASAVLPAWADGTRFGVRSDAHARLESVFRFGARSCLEGQNRVQAHLLPRESTRRCSHDLNKTVSGREPRPTELRRYAGSIWSPLIAAGDVRLVVQRELDVLPQLV